jgi:hypothetical protein
LPTLRSFDEFLGTFSPDEEGWYGPASWTDDSSHYYVGVVNRPWDSESGTLLYLGRWHVVAVIRQRDVTFHWQNPPSPKGMQEPRHFVYVKNAISRFMRECGLESHELNLRKLFLDDLWEEYRIAPLEASVAGEASGAQFDFEDTYIHARDRGISLTARISKSDAMRLLGDDTKVGSDTEVAIDLKRIKDLTDKLTVAALGPVAIADMSEDEIALANQRVLTEFIKGWSPRTYECMILNSNGEDDRNVFMAKAFFGNDSRHGEFVHLKCHPEFGRSWAAAEFILRKLDEW